jgi:hypothetical protein
MGREMSLEELLTWLLYLFLVVLPINSMNAENGLLLLVEVYFVISAARAGRNVVRPELPAGLLILNLGFMVLDVGYEMRAALVMLTTIAFILWGIKITLEVKA